MIPLFLLLGGFACLAGGLGLLRWLGPRLRVARILATAPTVSIEEAGRLARAGSSRFVRVRGRVSSEEEFPDDLDRPLVYRRRRLELRPPGAASDAWQVIEDEVEAVPFSVEQRGASIAVDAAHLDEGLVTLSREAQGTAAEVPERVPAGTHPAAAVRYRILQISAVEHVDVAGLPALEADGRPTMTAGLGRPLIVSTLDQGDAMRVIAGGRRTRISLATGLMALGLVLLVCGLALGLVDLAGPAAVRAASPGPTPTAEAGDTRTSGQGPGLVGEPFLALLGVVAVAVVTVGATTLIVRLERRD